MNNLEVKTFEENKSNQGIYTAIGLIIMLGACTIIRPSENQILNYMKNQPRTETLKNFEETKHYASNIIATTGVASLIYATYLGMKLRKR